MCKWLAVGVCSSLSVGQASRAEVAVVFGGWAAGVKKDRKKQLMVRRSEAGKARAEHALKKKKRSVQRHVKYAFLWGIVWIFLKWCFSMFVSSPGGIETCNLRYFQATRVQI